MGHIEVVKLLLEKGARPNFEDEPGRTPLSRVSYSGRSHAAVIELLNFYCTLEVPCNNPIPKPRTNVSINDWLLGVRTILACVALRSLVVVLSPC
jgi:ankyrin repeat protein